MASDFGTQVREARQRKGWSQTQLGVKVGLSKNAIFGIERGAQPKVTTRDALVRALEIGQQAPEVQTAEELQGWLDKNLRTVIAVEARRLAQEQLVQALEDFHDQQPELAAQAGGTLRQLLGLPPRQAADGAKSPADQVPTAQPSRPNQGHKAS